MLARNPMMSPTVQALNLGEGDALRTQLSAQEEERKRKLLRDAQQAQGTGQAAQSLFGTGAGLQL